MPTIWEMAGKKNPKRKKVTSRPRKVRRRPRKRPSTFTSGIAGASSMASAQKKYKKAAKKRR